MNINNYIFAGVSFAIGAITGGTAAWFVSKKRYEKRHQEEMITVWADVRKKKGEKETIQEAEPDISATTFTTEKPDLAELANKIREQGYTAPDLPNTNDFIHEISENDLDEDEYQIIELVLYADGILVDDKDVPIKDVAFVVGDNYLNIMNGKDEAFIRNEKTKIDYDICRSMLSYGEMLERHPETEQRLRYNDALNNFYENEDDEQEDDDE